MMTREEASGRIRDHMRHHGIGEYPHFKLGEALNMALAALRPVSREQVEKVWRGTWKHYLPPLGAGDVQCRCTRCGMTPDSETPFCAYCGAPMTDEAVDMMLEMWKEAAENA